MKVTLSDIKNLKNTKNIRVKGYVRSTDQYWIDWEGTPSEVYEEIKDERVSGLRKDLYFILVK